MKLWTKTLSQILLALSVLSVSGCFVDEVNVTGSLAPTSLGLSDNILLQNATTINVTDIDVTNYVDSVSSLTMNLTTDCSNIDMAEFTPATGEINLDGRVLTAVSSLCVEPTHAQLLKTQYSQVLLAQGLNHDDIFKSCTGTETCENLRIALFILTDGVNDYGLQLELMSETDASEPYLTLLTIVGDSKLEYYGEVITDNDNNVTPFNEIELSISTLESLDIDALNISKKDKKKLEKDLQKAVKDLDKALKPKYWTDKETLTEVGDDVFSKVAKAVKRIEKSKKSLNGNSSDPSVQAFLATLNEIQANLANSMKDLVAKSIADAQATNGNQGDIAAAIAKLAEGDQLIAAGKLDKGIKKYESAWEELL